MVAPHRAAGRAECVCTCAGLEVLPAVEQARRAWPPALFPPLEHWQQSAVIAGQGLYLWLHSKFLKGREGFWLILCHAPSLEPKAWHIWAFGMYLLKK